MADMHPQNNFTSEFSEEGGSNAALTVNVNGEARATYTPDGSDQSVDLTEPVIFEMNEHPTYAEINPVVGLHVPVYLHISGSGIDYMVPYVGQESGGEGLRFAIPDSQNKCIRYWICRDGASWVSGIVYPDAIETVTPTYAKAKSTFDAGQTQCIKYSGLVYMLANATNTEATYISRDGATLKTLTIDTDNFINVSSYKVARDLGWLGIHGTSYNSDKYVKVCELDAYPFRAIYNTRFQINISPNTNSGTNGESAIFDLSIHCHDDTTFDEGINASWECVNRQSLGTNRIAQCVVTFNSNGKVEVWLEFVNAANMEAYITVLANDGDAAGVYSGSTFAGPSFVYPDTYVKPSDTSWDAGATSIYKYPAYEMTTALIVRLDELDSTAAESMVAAKADGKPIIVVKNDTATSKYLITAISVSASKYIFRGIGRTDKDTGTGVVILEYTRSTQAWATTYTSASLMIDGSAIGSVPSGARAEFVNDILTVIGTGGIVTISNQGCIGYFSNVSVSGTTTSITFVALLMINATQMGTHISVISYDSSANSLALATYTRNWTMAS